MILKHDFYITRLVLKNHSGYSFILVAKINEIFKEKVFYSILYMAYLLFVQKLAGYNYGKLYPANFINSQFF